MIFPKNYEPKEGEQPGYCALGRICYSCVDEYTGAAEDIDGYLLYVKATLTGTEPKDIYNYARAHDAFPHESTGDQMYSEEQFESYRELGAHAFKRICETYGVEEFESASPPQELTVERLCELIKERTGAPPHCD
jgi:hypothetical protein